MGVCPWRCVRQSGRGCSRYDENCSHCTGVALRTTESLLGLDVGGPVSAVPGSLGTRQEAEDIVLLRALVVGAVVTGTGLTEPVLPGRVWFGEVLGPAAELPVPAGRVRATKGTSTSQLRSQGCAVVRASSGWSRPGVGPLLVSELVASEELGVDAGAQVPARVEEEGEDLVGLTDLDAGDTLDAGGVGGDTDGALDVLEDLELEH